MSKRDSPLLYVILGLVALNLALTASLWLSRTSPSSGGKAEVSSLPEFASGEDLQSLAERVQGLYNSGDTAALYAEFDRLAKQQFSEQDLETQLMELAEVVGQIESSAFSHHEASRYGDFNAYALHYKVRLTGGTFPTGRMKISVIDRGGSFGLIGLNLHAGVGE